MCVTSVQGFDLIATGALGMTPAPRINPFDGLAAGEKSFSALLRFSGDEREKLTDPKPLSPQKERKRVNIE